MRSLLRFRLMSLVVGTVVVGGILIGVSLLTLPINPAGARLSSPAPLDIRVSAAVTSPLRLIGWNDLGMHCMNESFANLAVLPPFNTMWAQVVRPG